MDTWSVARISLDLIFAILVAGLVTGFLYHREKKLQSQFVDTLARSLEWGLDQRPQAQPTPRAVSVEQTSSPRAPIHAAGGYSTQKSFTKTTSPKINRAEKYLEAVRMYREGSDRNEIEKNLGISFMELELLGRIS